MVRTVLNAVNQSIAAIGLSLGMASESSIAWARDTSGNILFHPGWTVRFALQGRPLECICWPTIP